mmetsp:Transcript_9264/g.23856  ORF Transcript_9264/g.23856 Transcript_9264/m.23856 type:complete len:209 (+) Transcript_9264:1013-1639(+)
MREARGIQDQPKDLQKMQNSNKNRIAAPGLSTHGFVLRFQVLHSNIYAVDMPNIPGPNHPICEEERHERHRESECEPFHPSDLVCDEGQSIEDAVRDAACQRRHATGRAGIGNAQQQASRVELDLADASGVFRRDRGGGAGAGLRLRALLDALIPRRLLRGIHQAHSNRRYHQDNGDRVDEHGEEPTHRHGSEEQGPRLHRANLQQQL